MNTFAPFDAADYLDNAETIAECITAAQEDHNPDVFLTAVRDVARARGMAQLAKDAGLGRESLYKTLAPGAKPRYDTMLKCSMLLASSSPLLPSIHEVFAIPHYDPPTLRLSGTVQKRTVTWPHVYFTPPGLFFKRRLTKN